MKKRLEVNSKVRRKTEVGTEVTYLDKGNKVIGSKEKKDLNFTNPNIYKDNAGNKIDIHFSREKPLSIAKYTDKSGKEIGSNVKRAISYGTRTIYSDKNGNELGSRIKRGSMFGGMYVSYTDKNGNKISKNPKNSIILEM